MVRICPAEQGHRCEFSYLELISSIAERISVVSSRHWEVRVLKCRPHFVSSHVIVMVDDRPWSTMNHLTIFAHSNEITGADHWSRSPFHVQQCLTTLNPFPPPVFQSYTQLGRLLDACDVPWLIGVDVLVKIMWCNVLIFWSVFIEEFWNSESSMEGMFENLYFRDVMLKRVSICIWLHGGSIIWSTCIGRLSIKKHVLKHWTIAKKFFEGLLRLLFEQIEKITIVTIVSACDHLKLKWGKE